MADLDLTAFNAALMEYYDNFKLVELVAIESPMLAMLIANGGEWLGSGSPIPMVTDPGQAAISASFSKANTNRTPADYKRFKLDTIRRHYAIGSVHRDTIEAAKTPKAAFADVKIETNAKLQFLARELAHNLFRSENGLCGKIATGGISEGGGETTIVVTDMADIRNLGPGARLVASATEAGAARDTAAEYVVKSVVHSSGTLVLTGTANATSGWDAGDYLHRAGDAPNGGAAVVPSGFQDWIKGSAVTSATFRGVDRSVNPELLAGIVLSIGSASIKEAVSELSAHLINQGVQSPNRIFWVNPLRYAALEAELDSTATHEKVVPRGLSAEMAAVIGYNAIRIAAGNGSIRIMSDPFCPYLKGFMLDMSSWKFLALGGKKFPRLRDMHGGSFLQLADEDAVKFQGEVKGDLGCQNPGANAILEF